MVHSRLAPLFLALFLTACSSMLGGELIREGVPTGRIVIINATGGDLNLINISQCSAMSHGINRLPYGVSIPNGQSYSFTVSAGCYDVIAGWRSTYGYEMTNPLKVQMPAGGVRRVRILP